MSFNETNDMQQSVSRNCPNVSEADATLALRALVWTLSDDDRAHRLLAITGLDAQVLRARAANPEVLSAVISFLANHEADLVTCATALDENPARLAAIAGRQER